MCVRARVCVCVCVCVRVCVLAYLSKRGPRYTLTNRGPERSPKWGHFSGPLLVMSYIRLKSSEKASGEVFSILIKRGTGCVCVKSSQVTFIYIALLTIQIVTKHCTISK